ncbi:hypothetical protein ABZP36_033528 [Zizania latifolia]
MVTRTKNHWKCALKDGIMHLNGRDVLFNKVISPVGAQKETLHPDDIFLLANFILSFESFRTSESFSPICIPRYNPMAFLYAYVHFFDVKKTYKLPSAKREAELKDFSEAHPNFELLAAVFNSTCFMDRHPSAL